VRRRGGRETFDDLDLPTPGDDVGGSGAGGKEDGDGGETRIEEGEEEEEEDDDVGGAGAGGKEDGDGGETRIEEGEEEEEEEDDDDDVGGSGAGGKEDGDGGETKVEGTTFGSSPSSSLGTPREEKRESREASTRAPRGTLISNASSLSSSTLREGKGTSC